MLDDLEDFGFVLAAFSALLGGLTILRRFAPYNPEILRKVLHGGMGLVALSLPWLFASAWPVIVLAGSLIAALLAIRLVPPLRKGLGGIIYDVGRSSWGEIYFALGVACLFALSGDDPLFYSVPVLVLALADATASLVGGRYGRLRFEAWGGHKSVEGSVAFLAAAFCITALGLLAVAALGRTDSLIVALALALPLSLVEAVAGQGSDNFFVPLAAFVLLKSLLAVGQTEVTVFLAITVVAVPRAFLFLYDRTQSKSAARRGLGADAPGLRNCA